MPPHNSLHTVSGKFFGPAVFQSTDQFMKDCVFALKVKAAQKIGDGDERTARPFRSIRRGKEEMR